MTENEKAQILGLGNSVLHADDHVYRKKESIADVSKKDRGGINTMSIWKWNHAGLFVGGMLFATKGIELLAGKTAHKAYVQATAFGLRCRDGVMENVTAVREGCEDIYAEAVELNEERNNAPGIEVEVIEDKSKGKKAAKKPAEKAAK